MNDHDNNREPKALSPTPLKDWLIRQKPESKIGGVILFAILIGCGALAPATISLSIIPGSQQLLFVLLAGVILGSRLGAVSAVTYLVAAAFTGQMWPYGSGTDPLTGPASGFLWSLPAAAYLSGFAVDRFNSEKPAHYAIGVCAGIGIYHTLGILRLVAALDGASAKAFLNGAGIYLGQHIAHAAIAVLIASTASDLLRAREQK